MARARIAVIEDNALNRRLVRDVLEHRGHEVLEAATIEEARALLRAATPDLVLLDVQVPGGGGELLLREIREAAALPRVPVIAVTAFAMEGDRGRLLAAGFDGYISKPIEVRVFGAQVEAFLTEERSRAAR